MENKLNFKVSLVGPSDSRKNDLIKRICLNQSIHNPKPNYTTATFIEKNDLKDIILTIWDMPGSTRYKSLGPMYWNDSNSFIFLYNGETQSPDVLEEFYQLVKGSVQNQCYMIVAANIDYNRSKNVNNEEIKQWCNQKGLEHTEISTVTGGGINELLSKIATECYEMSKSNT